MKLKTCSDDVTQRIRQQNLITRYNDLFATDRLDAMDVLKRYSSDHENNQRIVFHAIQVRAQSAHLSLPHPSFDHRKCSPLIPESKLRPQKALASHRRIHDSRLSSFGKDD